MKNLQRKYPQILEKADVDAITHARQDEKHISSSFHLFQPRYTLKQEKDYAIQRIGVGLARRS